MLFHVPNCGIFTLVGTEVGQLRQLRSMCMDKEGDDCGKSPSRRVGTVEPNACCSSSRVLLRHVNMSLARTHEHLRRVNVSKGCDYDWTPNGFSRSLFC